MAANVLLRSIALGAPEWTPLADVPTVVDATLMASSKNANPVNVRFRGGPAVSWPPNGSARFGRVDLAQIEVQGASGHEVLVVGASAPIGAGAAARRFAIPAVLPGDIEP